MAGIKALKIRCEAFTASFRYPRLQAGTLKTFEMPPPATIYGHLASVIGEWFDPGGLAFAYLFEHEGKGIDMETRQPLEPGSGKNTKAKKGWDFPVNVECEPNPQGREFLFRPKMTLYLTGNDVQLKQLNDAFLSPRYGYVIGRSQDLASCRWVRNVELNESPDAVFSHTLVPYDWRPWVLPGTSVMMPEVIDYRRNRQARHARYLQITSQPLSIYSRTEDVMFRDRLPSTFLVDEQETRELGGHVLARGLYFFPVLNSLQ
jgi:CRISPR-associated protein Cas5t